MVYAAGHSFESSCAPAGVDSGASFGAKFGRKGVANLRPTPHRAEGRYWGASGRMLESVDSVGAHVLSVTQDTDTHSSSFTWPSFGRDLGFLNSRGARRGLPGLPGAPGRPWEGLPGLPVLIKIMVF